MANRYANLVGTKKISEDFNNINIGFDKVQTEMDTNKGTADTHIKNADIHVTAAKKAEWDAKSPGSTQVDLKAHTDNADIHVTKAKKEEWDSKAAGSTATDLVNHKADKVVHVTQDDHDKLDGIEEGAQVNQNAFAKVNDIEAADPSSQLYIVEGIGIRVTTNPNTGEITITATGDAAPGAHGPTHTEFGADPIPTATLTEGGLLSAAQFAEIVAHGELLEEHAEALNTLEDRLDIEERQDVVLNAGMQILNAQRRAAFSLSGIKGRTLVNLLGREGNCENVSRFVPWQATLTSDTANKTQGSQSLKITTTASPGGSGASTGFPVKAGSYYLIVADVKLGSGTSIGAYINGLTSSKGNTNSTDTTKFKTVWKAYSVSTAATVYAVGEVVGSSGSFGYVDAIRVYEISAADYAALDNMTLEQVDAKYTYVDSVQPVRNPYAIRYGENLLPPFYEWNNVSDSTRTKVVIDKPYRSSMTVDKINDQSLKYSFNVIPNHSYTYTAKVSGYVSTKKRPRIAYVIYDSKGVQLATDTAFASTDGELSLTIPAKAAAQLLEIYFSANSPDDIGTFSISDPMLTLGTEAKTFKPREDAMLALQTDLYADPLTGSNADEVFEKDGQYFKLAKWKKVVLDDSISGLGTTGFTGFKVAVMNMIGGAPSSDMVTKYDGKVLSKKTNAFTTGDMAALESDSKLRISIFNTDSGWGDNYTPTADEIKAYFMGWKMFDANDGATWQTPYNRTDGLNKRWAKIYCGVGTNGSGPSFGTVAGSGVSTVPTVINDMGYTPYQLVYQLATPTVEPIVSEGMLTFNEGENQIEVGSGMVVRERTNPISHNNTHYLLNHELYPASLFKYVNKKIIKLYRDSLSDPRWYTVDDSYAHGNERASIIVDLYDPSAAYSVTYLMLDKSPIVPFSGSYAANEKSMLQDLTDAVQQNATAVSVLMNKKADKDAPAVQITPTLLNGWVEYQDGYHPVRYYKDSSGVVHLTGLVKSGAVSSILFKLASGFRPNFSLMFAAHASINSTVRIDVYKNGEIFFNYVGQWDANAWVSLDGIMFLAEQ